MIKQWFSKTLTTTHNKKDILFYLFIYFGAVSTLTFYFIKIFFIVVQLQLSPFSSHLRKTFDRTIQCSLYTHREINSFFKKTILCVLNFHTSIFYEVNVVYD